MKQAYLSLFLLILFACSEDNASVDTFSNTSGSEGIAGSLAQFVMDDNHLYVIDDQNLFVYDASQPNELNYLGSQFLGQGIETIFPYGDYLFFGTNSGMHIYDKSTPSSPQFVSTYQHIVACDPVTVNGNYAYVTLREEAFPGQTFPCTQGVSELQVVDISDIQYPHQVGAYSQSNPIGLSSKQNQLFVCDNVSGLHVYDISAAPSLALQTVYEEVKGHDVIIADDIMMVISNNELNQFRLTANGIQQLSEIVLL